jgi:hypothetical protein
MGKKGKIKLVLPKNSANKLFIDFAIKILYKNGGEMDSEMFFSQIRNFISENNAGSDATSAIHKSIMPRYFGLVIKNSKTYSLTSLGENYAQAKILEKQIDIIFDSLSTISFGRNNEAVDSDSNVEAPIVLIKLIYDLKNIQLKQYSIMLYYLEVLGMTYKESLKKITSLDKLALDHEKELAYEAGAQKLFDPKIHKFFESLQIIETDNDTKLLRLSKYVLSEFSELINNFIIVGSGEKQNKEIYQSQSNLEKLSKKLEDIIEVIKNEDEIKLPDFIDNNEAIIGNKLNSHQSSSNLKKAKFSDHELFLLGWSGEKYFHHLLNNKNYELLNRLNFDENEIIENIDWYNNGFEENENWIDKSIGKGCDIFIKTNTRTLFIEVKTSFSNVQYYTLTGNEIISMKQNLDNYYLVKINKLKNLIASQINPEITILDKPFKRVLEISKIKSLTVYL